MSSKPSNQKPTINSFSSYMNSYEVPAPNSTTSYAKYPSNMYIIPGPQSYVPIYMPTIMNTNVLVIIPCSNLVPGTYTGRIKFFDLTQKYGFFVLDCNGSDLFVHYADFLKAGMTEDQIQIAKAMNIRFSFQKVDYYGKYNLSSKAINLQVIQ